MTQIMHDQADAHRKSPPIKELIVSLMHWRQKWGIKYRKIEVKIKEEVAYVSVTDDYTPQDFEIKG